MLRRSTWTLADQGLWAVSNFGLGVLVARMVSPAEFGAFSVCFTLYLLAVGASRAVASEPLLVRHSGRRDEHRAVAVAASAGLATAVGLGAGALVVAAGAAWSGSLGRTLMALGVLLPALLLQDALRYGFLAAGRPEKAFVNDGVWAIAQVGLVLAASALMGRTAVTMVAAWAGAGAVAALAGCVQAGVVPLLREGLAWGSAQRSLSGPFLAEFALTLGLQQLILLAVVPLASLEALGAVRAGQILLGPLRVVILSLAMVAVPEGVRFSEDNRGSERGAALFVSSLSVLCGLVYGGLAMAIPDRIGEHLLGRQWGPASRLLLPLVTAILAYAAMNGPLAGLRVLAAARQSLRARATGAALALIAGVAGAATHGAIGAAWGLAVAGLLSAAVYWWQFEDALGRARRRGALPGGEAG